MSAQSEFPIHPNADSYSWRAARAMWKEIDRLRAEILSAEVKAREITRLRQIAELLEKAADELESDNGAFIRPKSQEDMKALNWTEVRSRYRAAVNGHIPIRMREYARHCRVTANILLGMSDVDAGFAAVKL